MAGDVQNKIVIGFESVIFLASLVIVILHKVGNVFILWVTSISWLIFLGTVGYFIIKLIQKLNN